MLDAFLCQLQRTGLVSTFEIRVDFAQEFGRVIQRDARLSEGAATRNAQAHQQDQSRQREVSDAHRIILACGEGPQNGVHVTGEVSSWNAPV